MQNYDDSMFGLGTDTGTLLMKLRGWGLKFLLNMAEFDIHAPFQVGRYLNVTFFTSLFLHVYMPV
jgi:hypothetical protein